MKEWYHIECIGMKKQDIPGEGGAFITFHPHTLAWLTCPVAWFCKECIRDRVGKVRSQKPGIPAIITKTNAQRIKNYQDVINAQAFLQLEQYIDDDDEEAANDVEMEEKEYAKGEGKVRPHKYYPKNITQPAKSAGPWTDKEKQHLIEVVTDIVNVQDVHGDAVWELALPAMRARGVDRVLGALRMVWMRELREVTGVDERRQGRKRAGLVTAVQGSCKK